MYRQTSCLRSCHTVSSYSFISQSLKSKVSQIPYPNTLDNVSNNSKSIVSLRNVCMQSFEATGT